MRKSPILLPMDIAYQLRLELARRTAINPQYSMRSLASSLEMSPSHLCEVLSGRKEMSLRARQRISRKLGWAKGRATQRIAPAGLGRLSWWHLALLELANHEKLKNKPASIARRLGISLAAAKHALRDLQERGLLEIAGDTLHPVKDRLFFGDGTPSQTIRNFHKDTLRLAARQLELTCYEDREFSFSTLALSSSQAQEFRKRVRDVVEEFSSAANEASLPESEKEIFGLGIQFYRISQRKNSRGREK